MRRAGRPRDPTKDDTQLFDGDDETPRTRRRRLNRLTQRRLRKLRIDDRQHRLIQVMTAMPGPNAFMTQPTPVRDKSVGFDLENAPVDAGDPRLYAALQPSDAEDGYGDEDDVRDGYEQTGWPYPLSPSLGRFDAGFSAPSLSDSPNPSGESSSASGGLSPRDPAVRDGDIPPPLDANEFSSRDSVPIANGRGIVQPHKIPEGGRWLDEASSESSVESDGDGFVEDFSSSGSDSDEPEVPLPAVDGPLEWNDLLGEIAGPAERILQHLDELPTCASCRTRLPASGVPVSAVGLEGTYDADLLPMVLDSERLLGEASALPPLPPDVKSSRRVLCGLPSDGGAPLKVDLGLNRPSSEGSLERSFDVDSIVGVIPSLGVLKKVMIYHPDYNPIQANIYKDLHVRADGIFTDADTEVERRSAVDIRKIPHHLIGTFTVGQTRVSILMAFPRLFDPRKDFLALTKEHRAYLQDRIIRPAMAILPAGILQHSFVSSADHQYRSTARSVESRSNDTRGYGVASNDGYVIRAEYLEKLWDRIRRNIARGGRAEFSQPILFVDCKNMKIDVRTPERDASLPRLIADLHSWLDEAFDVERLDPSNFFVDIVKEITDGARRGSRRAETDGDVPFNTYLFKRCCLEEIRLGLHGRETKAQYTVFNNFLLADAAHMRCVPSPKEDLARAGLRYSQYYSVQKGVLDARNAFPFASPNLDELAVDKVSRGWLASAAKTSVTPIEVIRKSYTHSKRRTYHALAENRNKSFGVRYELRMSLALVVAMEKLLDDDAGAYLSLTSPDPRMTLPPCVWLLRTATLSDFVLHTVNKYCAYLELCLYAANQIGAIGLGHTQFVLTMIRVLRYSVHATDVRRDSFLALRSRFCDDDDEVERRRGLGLSENMERYRFAWLPPMFDFQNMAFKERYQDRLLLVSSNLTRRFKKNNRVARDAADDDLTIAQKTATLSKQLRAEDRYLIFLTDAHIVLRQFRRDVFAKTSTDHAGGDMTPDEFALSYEGVRELFGVEPYLAWGNKQKAKTFHQLFLVLFGIPEYTPREDLIPTRSYEPNHTWIRKGWDELPYRQAIRRTLQAIAANDAWGERAKDEFFAVLKAESVKWHWFYPVPTPLQLSMKEKNAARGVHTRKWFSLVHREKPIVGTGLDIKWEHWRDAPPHGCGRATAYRPGKPKGLTKLLENLGLKRAGSDWTQLRVMD